MSSSAGVQEEKVKKFRGDARKGKWHDVWKTYKKERELRTEKITEKEDTVLHMALSENVWWAMEMVSLLLEEQKEKTVEDDQSIELGVEDGVRGGIKEVFWAKNKKGNTVLHLAASMGYFKLCYMIGEAEPSLVRERNIDGETPLFLAAHSGNKRVFLWLHYLCIESHAGYSLTDNDHAHCIQRNNHDTILHIAIAQGHIDVAIEIFHLYRDDLVNSKEMKRNNGGLSPLHLLAATPSAFESTSLQDRFIIVHLLYRLFSVKEKEKATTKEEVAPRKRKPIPSRAIRGSLIDSVLEIPGVKFIFSLLGFIILVLLGLTLALPLFILALILVAGNWLLDIRKMKEKHSWYGQIMNGLLEHASDEEMLKIKHDNAIETPLMIAAKNGAAEMVGKILEKFPSMINDVIDEKKNIVLVAAENRQTMLYQFLLRQKDKLIPESAFRQVDEHGNTALHLAAMSGANLNWQATTMIEESKWFELVKRSVPSDFGERHNKDGKSAARIFQDSYRELMKADLEWLNKTSQACSVVSSLVATMVFPNVATSSNNDSGKPIPKSKFGFKALPNPYLVTLSLSLMSTISFLGILASRFQSTSFWMHVPFMLHIGMFFMFASLASLWISLMLHDHSTTTYAILGSPIGFLIILLLPGFVGPTLKSMFSKVPRPSRPTTDAIINWYQKTEKNEKGTDSNPAKMEQTETKKDKK